MNDEATEALRSAQDLVAFLWHNTNAIEPGEANIELLCHTDRHAEQLAALLNDARARLDAALHGLVLQAGDVGSTRPHGPVSERLMRKWYGPPR